MPGEQHEQHLDPVGTENYKQHTSATGPSIQNSSLSQHYEDTTRTGRQNKQSKEAVGK